MAETDGKLAEFRNLPEDLLGDEMNTSVLRPEVDLGLEPAGADLDAAIGGGHGWRGDERCAGRAGGSGRSEQELLLARRCSTGGGTARWITPGGRRGAPFGDGRE